MDERATNLLTAHREKLLYLVVGGWNTLFQYGVFSLCWYLLSPAWPPIPILLISYLIASVNGFLGFRYIVFKPKRHPLLEYLKFQVVYVPLLVLNMVGLPLLLKHTHLSAYAIQALFGIFVIIVAYLGNKYFTFRPLPRRTPADKRRRVHGDGDSEANLAPSPWHDRAPTSNPFWEAE